MKYAVLLTNNGKLKFNIGFKGIFFLEEDDNFPLRKDNAKINPNKCPSIYPIITPKIPNPIIIRRIDIIYRSNHHIYGRLWLALIRSECPPPYRILYLLWLYWIPGQENPPQHTNSMNKMLPHAAWRGKLPSHKGFSLIVLTFLSFESWQAEGNRRHLSSRYPKPHDRTLPGECRFR